MLLTPQIEVREVGTDFTNAVTNSGDAVAYSGTSVTGTVTVTGLISGKTYHWQARINNSAGGGTWSSYGANVESATDFRVDASAPTGESISINSGSANTSSRSITLTISATDADSGLYQMIVSENSDFSGSSWETYSTSKSQTLSSGDGTKTVYAKFKDNIGNESSSVSDTIVLDTTAPAGIDLDSPGDNSYTNSKRPTFKWKATTDVTVGLSKYVLEIDNPTIGAGQPNGDITVDDIPTSRTIDYETNKYTIRYENFSDSDANNNYISVYTKSSSEWSTDSNSGQNDGKAREGKVNWKVKAVDSVGNETTVSRILFVDRNSPKVEFTQINDSLFISPVFSTTDRTPTIFGKITDSLAGADNNGETKQDENGPKIVSGPKQVEIKIEKQEGSLYKIHTIYTINMDKPWYTCDNKEVSDNSKQKCDKYLPFEYTPSQNLGFGTYKITIAGKDKADNSSSSISFTLNITSLAQYTTQEEKKVIDEELKNLQPEEKEKIKEELELTRPEAISTTIKQEKSNRVEIIIGGFKNFLAYIKEVAGYGAQALSDSMKQPKKTIANLGEWISYTTTSFGEIVLDKEPTKISDVKVERLTANSVVVVWRTNHLATSKINYGETLDYGKDVQSSRKVHDHKIEITGLNSETKYYYEVMSQNKNYVYDAHHEFITPKK